ncbi:MAG: type II toxin-antitoxin system HicA family toxin [SAR324 cluster bacterium]|nr:type II toxin-antitoxin system HicA family toxin [SAR324 cluster bacterium]
MKVREVLRLLEDDGWFQETMRSSHRQYRHPTKPGKVTVAGHGNKDIHPKTLGYILNQAQLERSS